VRAPYAPALARARPGMLPSRVTTEVSGKRGAACSCRRTNLKARHARSETGVPGPAVPCFLDAANSYGDGDVRLEKKRRARVLTELWHAWPVRVGGEQLWRSSRGHVLMATA
jgi:hypothetical protein